MYYDQCNSSFLNMLLMPSEDGHNWPKHVLDKGIHINIYICVKLNVLSDLSIVFN
jgi:hypothetical protein